MSNELRSKKKKDAGKNVPMETTVRKMFDFKNRKEARMLKGLFSDSEFEWLTDHYLNMVNPEEYPLKDDPWTRQHKKAVKDRTKGASMTLLNALNANAIFTDEEWADMLHPGAVSRVLYFNAFRHGQLNTIVWTKDLEAGLNHYFEARGIRLQAKITLTLEPEPISRPEEVAEMMRAQDKAIKKVVAEQTSKTHIINYMGNDTGNEIELIDRHYHGPLDGEKRSSEVELPECKDG